MQTDGFIGQESIILSLDTALNNNEISHAYIFEGPDGIGKRTLARVFAQSLLCESNDKPCGYCMSCNLFKSNNHPDFKEISIDSNILVENTREIVKDINTKPYYGGKKVYIIENAHTMTDGAQNSLLKTLEEPPEYVVMILTTNNINVLLPTVTSRCSIKKFKRNSREEVEKYIQTNIPQYNHNSKVLVALCDGIIGNINKIVSPDFDDTRKFVTGAVKKILTGNRNDALETAKLFAGYKDTIDVLLNIMVLLFRDLLILKEVTDTSYLVNIDYLNDLEGLGRRIDKEKIDRSIRAINKAQNDLLAHANLTLTLETMSLKINA